MAETPLPGDDRVPYAVFGERFFEHAVTEERIVGGFDGLAGNKIEFGPIGAGPGKLAKVRAEGTFGQRRPSGSRETRSASAFRSRSRSTCT